MPDINMQVFEEAKRNQLVTEVDIQTQVALENHQVQLSDIANPTQSQDNVVIDRYGEFLPHWNESLDFDTWVKMSMELAGKKLLMIHGNDGFSSVSNGVDTFIAFDDFNTDQLGSYWLGDTSLFTVSGGKITENDDNTWNILYHQVNLASSENWVAYAKTTIDSADTWLGIGLQDNTNPLYSNNYAAAFWLGLSTGSHRLWVSGGSVKSTTIPTGTYEIELVKNGTSYKTYRDSVEKLSDTQAEFANTYFCIHGLDGGTDINIVYLYKYIATEPTYTISTPKNIATALKSLGRAG